MDELHTLASRAVEDLLQSDEDQLFEELGIRVKAMEGDPQIAGSFDPVATFDGAAMGPLDGVRALGKRLFSRWHVEAYKLICGSELDDDADRKKVASAFGGGHVTVAAVVAGLLVTHFGLAPAIAGVVAALIAKRFFKPGYDEFCKFWQEKLPKT